MFEMQVRCVWVILNNQVRVNFSTNCKCRHIQYICRFLTIRFPLNLAPKCRKCHFRDSRFQNFRGIMPPDPLEILHLWRSIFAPSALGNQSQKSLHPPLEVQIQSLLEQRGIPYLIYKNHNVWDRQSYMLAHCRQICQWRNR